VPDLIQKLYAAYPKQGKSAAYPSEIERKRTAFQVQGIVDTMIQVFDAANYLLAAGQSDLAAVCYDHLLQTCKSPEIWNNLGLAYTFEALRLPPKDDYAYPLELDWQMRLNRPRGQTPTAEQLQQRQLFLLRAKIAFEEALRLSPGYFPAFANNCCVGLMAENAAEVQQNIKNYAQTKGIQGSESERLALISALAAAHMGDATKAEQLFAPLLESKISENSALAHYNLEVLQHGGDKAAQTNSTSTNSACPSDPMQYKLPSVLTLRRMAGAFEGLGLGKNSELTLAWERKADQKLFKARIGADRYCILQVNAVKRGPRLSVKMDKRGINGPEGARIVVCENQYLQVFKGGRMKGCGVFYTYRGAE
jgi:tetratricopeptide (TPR) repeat protein